MLILGAGFVGVLLGSVYDYGPVGGFGWALGFGLVCLIVLCFGVCLRVSVCLLSLCCNCMF